MDADMSHSSANNDKTVISPKGKAKKSFKEAKLVEQAT